MLSAYSLGLMAAFTTVGVTAQTYPSSTSSEATSTPTKTDAVTTHTINVGRDAHVFTPQETTASVGDIIKFNFFPGGHGVARAEFLNPCIPYEYANEKPGFWSGFFHPQAILNPPPSYEVQVNDTEPIFFYCAAPHSCTDWQMIGVINPNSTHTFKAQFAEAQKAQFQLVPGEPWPSETPKPKSTQTSAPGSGNNSDNQSGGGGGSGLSPGAIAGIAIGGVAVLVLAAALLYLCGRRGGFDKAYRKSALPVANVPAQPPMAEGGFPVSANPKSPGQSTVATFAAHDPYQGSPFFAQGPSPAGYHPVSPGLQPGYLSHQHTGYSDVNSHAYQPSHTSPQAPYQMAFEAPATAPAPVELPSSDVPPNPARSPPPQYSQTSKP